MADRVGDRRRAVAEPVDRAELAQAIDDALEALTDMQREVFLGCHEQGVPWMRSPVAWASPPAPPAATSTAPWSPSATASNPAASFEKTNWMFSRSF
jgi:hypothetical protein